MLRIQSPLTPEVEEIVHKTIGCGIAVHRALGPGLREAIYKRALCIELTDEAIPFEREHEIPVSYKGQLLCRQRLDLVVAGQVVVEIKCVDWLVPVHHAQIRSYLRVSGLRVGLLMNFNVPVLQDGLKRVVV
jgi:GxxExxY protein